MIVAQLDSQHPALGMAPTSRWLQGEVVGDYHELQLPFDLEPGVYSWAVVLYRLLPDGGWENLRVAGSGAELGIGTTLQIIRGRRQ